MFIAVDIGNTRTTCGIYEGEFLAAIINFPTLRGEITQIVSEARKELSLYETVKDICIASVVPQSTYQTCDALRTLYGDVPVRVLSHDDIPLDNSYRDPTEVGADRLLGSLAAYTKYGAKEKNPVIVIDMGTATVFDCIDKEGLYLGGAIALGIESSAKHLSQIAARLPQITLEFPKRVLGKTTEQSMQSGILFGALSMAEGMVKRLHEEVFPGEEPIVVATGGLAALINKRSPFITHYEPYLVLDGIRISHEEKKK
jgi:type III pantothenate kinase